MNLICKCFRPGDEKPYLSTVYMSCDFEAVFRDGNVLMLFTEEGILITAFDNLDQFESWRVSAERNAAWGPKNGSCVAHVDNLALTCSEEPTKSTTTLMPHGKDFVSPSHYKDYIAQMQWLDAMSQIPTLRAPVKFKAAVEMQVRKYLDRNGSKDEELQELKKSRFYLCYLVAYIENNCQMIRAEDVHKMLTGSDDLKQALEESHEALFRLEKESKGVERRHKNQVAAIEKLQSRSSEHLAELQECRGKLLELERRHATLKVQHRVQASNINTLLSSGKEIAELQLQLIKANNNIAELKTEVVRLKALKGVLQ